MQSSCLRASASSEAPFSSRSTRRRACRRPHTFSQIALMKQLTSVIRMKAVFLLLSLLPPFFSSGRCAQCLNCTITATPSAPALLAAHIPSICFHSPPLISSIKERLRTHFPRHLTRLAGTTAGQLMSRSEEDWPPPGGREGIRRKSSQ